MKEDLPDLLSIQAQEVVKRAKSLGLTWTLRPAIVNSSISDPILVKYDGDSEQVGAVSLAGTVFPGDHVMMIQVPPAGNFIIGKIGASTFLSTPVARGETRLAGDVTLTTSSQNVSDIISVTTTGSAEFIVTGTFDLDQTVSGGNNLAAGALQVDGVGLSEQPFFGVTAAGQRAAVSMTWYGTLTPDVHTFRLISSKSLNIGTFICRATNTGFVYQVWQ